MQGFTSFDEPYVHIKHNPQGRTVLMERPDPAGTREPWTWVRTQGQGLVFDPIPSLGVKGEVIYRVRVKGLVPGDHRFRVQLTCDQLRTPVIKEESTRFYKE